MIKTYKTIISLGLMGACTFSQFAMSDTLDEFKAASQEALYFKSGGEAFEFIMESWDGASQNFKLGQYNIEVEYDSSNNPIGFMAGHELSGIQHDKEYLKSAKIVSDIKKQRKKSKEESELVKGIFKRFYNHKVTKYADCSTRFCAFIFKKNEDAIQLVDDIVKSGVYSTYEIIEQQNRISLRLGFTMMMFSSVENIENYKEYTLSMPNRAELFEYTEDK